MGAQLGSWLLSLVHVGLRVQGFESPAGDPFGEQIEECRISANIAGEDYLGLRVSGSGCLHDFGNLAGHVVAGVDEQWQETHGTRGGRGCIDGFADRGFGQFEEGRHNIGVSLFAEGTTQHVVIVVCRLAPASVGDQNYHFAGWGVVWHARNGRFPGRD